MRGKENRAVIASNIMYIVGRYPRFLERHLSFVAVVCKKLFEFMKETFPGVQDMAVETFLKLCKLVPQAIVTARRSEEGLSKCFIYDIQTGWDDIIALLTAMQMHVAYRAVGYLIAAVNEEVMGPIRAPILAQILSTPSSALQGLAAEGARLGREQMTTVTFMRSLVDALRCCTSVATSCGSCFISVMTNIFPTLRMFFEGYSGEVNSVASAAGANAHAALLQQNVRLMRLVKKEILRCLQIFVDNTTDINFVAQTCMPHILDLVVADYANSHAAAKEPVTFALLSACVRRLESNLDSSLAGILNLTFDDTVAIISKNMVDLPELRVELFSLIKEMQEHCFEAFLAYVSVKEDVINGLLWAARHSEHTIMTVGLESLLGFVKRVRQSELAQPFFERYLQRIVAEVMVAAMDTLHTSGFTLHCRILMELFSVSRSLAPDMPVLGRTALTEFLVTSLSVVETLSVPQKQQFVDAFYQNCTEEYGFRVLFADFLIEVQVWGAEEENKLIEAEERASREQAVMGLSIEAGAGPAFYVNPDQY
jgi:exportin-1